MLACAMVFSAVVTSSATEYKIVGTYDAAFQWIDNPSQLNQQDPDFNGTDYFSAIQRLRTKIDIIANESLKAVAYFEVGTITWGKGGTSGRGSGGALGTDGVNIETKRLYLDYQVPHTSLQLRMGLEGLALPSLANNNPVLDDDVATIIANYTFTDQFNVVAAWARAVDTEDEAVSNFATSHDKYDVFTIIAGLNFEPVTVVPYITYAAIGQNADIHANLDGSNDRDVWWLGLSAKSNNLDKLNLAFDFVWGWSDDANIETAADRDLPANREQSGFYVLLHGDYKMDTFTPTLDLWYSSGDDDSEDGDGNYMPTISPGGLAVTNFGTDGGFFDTQDDAFTLSGVGTFGIVLGITDVSFLENVTHDFKVAYLQGTSDYSSSSEVNTFPTDEDRAWEFNINTNWQMYENLAAIVELAYLNPDYKSVADERASWKAALGFQYSY